MKLSHPAIIQITDGLIRAGLIRPAKDPGDARRRMFHLTPKGRRLMPTLEVIWQDIARAQIEAFRAAGWDVLTQLDRIEEELEETSIQERVVAMRKARPETPLASS